jgi:GR25 family glycosyltransferase involved in LPS biosynthesis
VAWRQFVTSSSSDWLLVLEDDALFTKAGPRSFWGILQEVGRLPENIPSHVLVSEGLDLRVIKVNSDNFVTVSSNLNATLFPFTNTAAAYLINRSMAKYFVSVMQEKPALAYNTIDFLINNMMLRIFFGPTSSKISCQHASNPPFQNASINGGYSSLISG